MSGRIRFKNLQNIKKLQNVGEDQENNPQNVIEQQNVSKDQINKSSKFHGAAKFLQE